VDEEVFGHATTVDLQPGGRSIAVTSQNRTLYIGLMADYHMNQRIRKQCQVGRARSAPALASDARSSTVLCGPSLSAAHLCV
jgi:hypothetical protein